MSAPMTLNASPHRAPARPRVGIAPTISDVELVTLAVMQARAGRPSEARWLRYVHAELRHLFPYLPQQPADNKRLRRLGDTFAWLIAVLARDTSLVTDDVRVVDSTPVECARSRDTVHRWDLSGWAEYGYCASHSRYFRGLRLPLLCTLHGPPIGFPWTGAKADEREVLLDILDTDPAVTAERVGQTVLADKNCRGSCPAGSPSSGSSAARSSSSPRPPSCSGPTSRSRRPPGRALPGVRLGDEPGRLPHRQGVPAVFRRRPNRAPVGGPLPCMSNTRPPAT
jgi:DDE family transposase